MYQMSDKRRDVLKIARQRREDLKLKLEKVEAFLADADRLSSANEPVECRLTHVQQAGRPRVLH